MILLKCVLQSSIKLNIIQRGLHNGHITAAVKFWNWCYITDINKGNIPPSPKFLCLHVKQYLINTQLAALLQLLLH